MVFGLGDLVLVEGPQLRPKNECTTGVGWNSHRWYDLGRRGLPFLSEPTHVPASDLLISESTYGGRLHDSVERMVATRRLAWRNRMRSIAFRIERALENSGWDLRKPM